MSSSTSLLHATLGTDALYVGPRDASSSQHLRLGLDDAALSVCAPLGLRLPCIDNIHGVLGVLRMELASYVLLSLDQCPSAVVGGATIYQLLRVLLLPLHYAKALATIELLVSQGRSAVVLQNDSSAGNGRKEYANTIDDPHAEVPQTLDLLRLRNAALSAAYSMQSTITEGLEVGLGTLGLAKQQHITIEKAVVTELERMLSSGTFYMSYDADISRSLANQKINSTERWDKISPGYVWNYDLVQPFLNANLSSWVYPIVQGYFQSEHCTIDTFTFQLTLCSRRSRKRAGFRYQRRGMDAKHGTANFVETEQILSTNINEQCHSLCFLQVRGSIPLFWSQSAKSLTPIPIVDKSLEENTVAMKAHFHDLISMYGCPILALNLVNQEGREAVVGAEYRKILAESALEGVRYIEFDFHRECPGTQYGGIQKLISTLERNLEQMGYLWIDGNSAALYQQHGIIRVNCMDCLDRTNVVQSALARHIIGLQLMRLGILATKNYDANQMEWKTVWANHGDKIAEAYTGTGALKGDFTRTGKRNIQGIARDASNSMSRFYINNFKDAYRQDVLDVFLGNKHYSTLYEAKKIVVEEAIDAHLSNKAISRLRDTALDAAERICRTGETILGSWIVHGLLTQDYDTLRVADQYDEILMITDKTLYLCTYSHEKKAFISSNLIKFSWITHVQTGAVIDYVATPGIKSFMTDGQHIVGTHITYQNHTVGDIQKDQLTGGLSDKQGSVEHYVFSILYTIPLSLSPRSSSPEPLRRSMSPQEEISSDMKTIKNEVELHNSKEIQKDDNEDDLSEQFFRANTQVDLIVSLITAQVTPRLTVVRDLPIILAELKKSPIQVSFTPIKSALVNLISSFSLGSGSRSYNSGTSPAESPKK